MMKLKGKVRIFSKIHEITPVKLKGLIVGVGTGTIIVLGLVIASWAFVFSTDLIGKGI